MRSQSQLRNGKYIIKWRPISLINVDAKIASKAIVLRIKKAIGKLVHCNQTAYMGNRNIGESVRLINGILEYTDENDIEAILFSAGFEKASDSVEHSFIISTLRSFGFGPDFIQWVKTFFKNVESCVMNNDRSTGYFHSKEAPDQETLFLHTFSFWLSKSFRFKSEKMLTSKAL